GEKPHVGITIDRTDLRDDHAVRTAQVRRRLWAVRTASPGRLLELRDRGCAFCAHHHRLVHKGAWTIRSTTRSCVAARLARRGHPSAISARGSVREVGCLRT
ncbi:MAG TPA: hypothetical protein VE287_05320, partial [Actinopolymorphaceae bacterium]|nr:hypothetical protein [Actinopolymorphaceae bacterium]